MISEKGFLSLTGKTSKGRLASRGRGVSICVNSFLMVSLLSGLVYGGVLLSELLNAKRTPWGEAYNHAELALNMDALLSRYGITNADQRARMTAHAIFASGWAQKVWHYNAWGVKRGSWPGDYYEMGTKEADTAGEYYDVPAEQWRAFENWKQAIDDFLTRISPTSPNPGYQTAARHLIISGAMHDAEYWDALGYGGYYTDKAFKGPDFAKLVARVRSEISNANPDQAAKAREFALENIEQGASRGWWGLALLALVGGSITWWLMRAEG